MAGEVRSRAIKSKSIGVHFQLVDTHEVGVQRNASGEVGGAGEDNSPLLVASGMKWSNSTVDVLFSQQLRSIHAGLSYNLQVFDEPSKINLFTSKKYSESTNGVWRTV